MNKSDLLKDKSLSVDTIEIHSEEIHDLIGRPNKKVEIFFAVVIMCILACVILCGILVRCPDMLSFRIDVKNAVPMEKVVAQQTFGVSRVFVKDKGTVRKNAVIALLDGGKDTLKSHIDGVLYYIGYDYNEHIIPQGTFLFAIISNKKSDPIGKVIVPSASIGKVCPGKKCAVNLDSYPSEDYGSMEGYIERVTPFPIDGENFIATIRFPKGWNTNIGKNIQTNITQIKGTVIIIVEERRLVDIILDPVKKYLI